ncbi:helix-turn-helix transcriptional regulator [Amycolatopsis sp. H20-H5]|uniref:helix-turn-helix transcriptional regulator n=1 Tax=Amycolatopsis sp. H20-H5 TaxID=3046309 RepID=UPI002DB667EA|nr:LuxR C-terminal-related transcriptional regulator [Amycolatopsis sp. H20-H5]MEC3976391.1 LuxR C-terminal-related transcriptional regulator [Amycolatopsis sp. H20-H5]
MGTMVSNVLTAVERSKPGVETVAEWAIGLHPVAELMYRVALSRPRWRLGELAAELAMPEPAARELAEELRRERVLAQSADDTDAIRAVEPCLALPTLTIRRLRDNASAAEMPQPAAVARFISLHERAVEWTGDEAHLDSADAVTSLVERLVATVRREIVLVVPRWRAGSFEFAPHIAEAALRRGAVLRQVWGPAVLDGLDVVTHARWLAARHAAPRTLPNVPYRMVIVDRSVVVMIDPRGTARVVQGRTPERDSLVEHALRLWERGTQFRHATCPVLLDQSGARNEKVLRLLADGLTDEAIARRIGVSVRTVRNDVASSMVTLQARSRFQAGMLAAQMGLI